MSCFQGFGICFLWASKSRSVEDLVLILQGAYAYRVGLRRPPARFAGLILCLSVFGEINDHLLNVGLRECTLLFGADGLL